jgi:hypothetical protein
LKNIKDRVTTFLLSIPLYLIYALLVILAPFIFSYLLISYTGEILRFLLTFGHHKPGWNFDSINSIPSLIKYSGLSMYLGFAFWLSLVVLIRYVFQCI